MVTAVDPPAAAATSDQPARHPSANLPAGASWAAVVRRAREVRLTCLADGAAAAMLLFSADDPIERLNVPDTLKAQMSARIAPPMVLMSDMGRALCSVVGSSLDWHDAITGHSLDRHLDGAGPSSFAPHRNAWRRSARDGLLLELEKRGMSARDLHATVNWFTKVAPGDDQAGTLRFVPGHARASDWVGLRTEVDVLMVASAAAHPMDPAPRWPPAAIRVEVGFAEPPGADDPSRLLRAESARALAAAEASYW